MCVLDIYVVPFYIFKILDKITHTIIIGSHIGDGDGSSKIHTFTQPFRYKNVIYLYWIDVDIDIKHVYMCIKKYYNGFGKF